jgi:prepilin-type N-terminal cleavage/methylation domain-containing protein
MKPYLFPKRSHGFSLIEVMISVGVLALVIPLVLGALLESGNSSASAAAETRSGWIVPACLDELKAAAYGRSKLVPNTPFGTAFPPSGEVYGIAFDVGGRLIGAVDKTSYDTGVKRLKDDDVRYIALIEGELLTGRTGAAPLRSIHISLEYPAAAPAAKRTKLDFFTQIP